MASVEECPHRSSVTGAGSEETASCDLLRTISGVEEIELCRVSRRACETCSKISPPTRHSLNSVIATHLYGLTRKILSRHGVPGCAVGEAEELQFWAELNLPGADPKPMCGGPTIRYDALREYLETPRTYACDVVVCCEDSSAGTARAIESVLEQENALARVHLVDDGGGAAALIERYRRLWNVDIHHNAERLGAFATVHDLVPKLHSEFVAVQDPRTVSRPGRIAYSVGLLEENGAEILAAVLQTPGGTVRAAPPQSEYRRYVPAATLVFRRATLVDMGGMAVRGGDEDAEFLWRAHREGRGVLFAPEVTVDGEDTFSRSPLGDAPDYGSRPGPPGHDGRGFPHERAECDVVLPFHGHLDYLEEAIESVLAQEGADAVIHLIDDASEGDVEDVLRYWRTHPQVRTYRNTRNVGQFTSFNNVAPYFETALVAVQDADDVSLPHRLHLASNRLRLAAADIFGGRSRYVDSSGATDVEPGDDRFCRSRYPQPGVGWFLMNPTAMFRVNTFTSLGGFGDFGDVLSNRCGLDTEFYSRAYYSGARFIVSMAEVLKYRRHDDQATINNLTGWTTFPRASTVRECRRREKLYRATRFDPRVFGAVGREAGVTRRVSS